MSRTLVIIRGVPGSGKSTIAKEVAKLLGEDKVDIFEADDYFTDEEGNYVYVPNEIGFAHEQCKANMLKSRKEVVIVANTFTREWEVTGYTDLFTKHYPGAKVLTYLCTHRFNNVHGVPEDVVNKMVERLEQLPTELILRNGFYGSKEIVKDIQE